MHSPHCVDRHLARHFVAHLNPPNKSLQSTSQPLSASKWTFTNLDKTLERRRTLSEHDHKVREIDSIEDATADKVQRTMFAKARHTSYSRRANDDPISATSAGQSSSGRPPNDRSTTTDDVHIFPIIHPSPGDDVFSTQGDRPAVTGGAYSLRMPRTTAGTTSILDGPTKDTTLPRGSGIIRAPSVASTSQSRRHNFPRSRRFEQLVESRASRRRLTAQAGYSQMAVVNHARQQGRLRKQLKHHKERVRDLESRMREGEELRQAGVERQTEEFLSLRRLAQGEVELEIGYTVDCIQTRSDSPVSVRRQLARTFHVERKEVATFDRPRKVARLKGGLGQPVLPPARVTKPSQPPRSQ
jgi:hypothetical protein